MGGKLVKYISAQDKSLYSQVLNAVWAGLSPIQHPTYDIVREIQTPA
jgi:hypothetical protein